MTDKAGLNAFCEACCAGGDAVAGVKLDLVWEPAWDMNRMSEAARLQLGIFD